MRRVLFHCGHHLVACEWRRGHCRRAGPFAPDAAGRDALRRWLAEAPHAPLQLLVDVLDEEFHLDRVPHVRGRDRAALLRRTAERHLRATGFRHVEVQGRDPDGRRDDRVLVAGLVRPEGLQAWLDVIDEAGVPLGGIQSLPLVGERLLPALGAGRAPRALLLSQQAPGSLRQSYYERGRLQFSRLVPLQDTDAGAAAAARHALDQALHFLEGQRFRSGGDPLEVFALVPGDGRPSWSDELAGGDGVHVQRVPLEHVARALGIEPGAGGGAEMLFARALLRRRRNRNHYAPARLRRAFFVLRARQALAAAAVVLVLASATTAGGTWLQAGAYRDDTARARARTAALQHARREPPGTPAHPGHRAADVRRAVDLLAALAAGLAHDPGPELAALGRVLAAHPRVRLRRLHWRLANGGTEEPGDGSGRTGAALAARALAGGGAAPEVVIEGELVHPLGDYRRGVERFEAFLAALRAERAFAAHEVLEAPFGLDPATGISGDSGTAAGGATPRAAFRVRLQGDRHGGT